MRSRTIRLALKWSFLVNVVMVTAVVLDSWKNKAELTVPLLILYAAFLVCVLLLFLADTKAKPNLVGDPRPIADQPEQVAISQRP